MPGLPGRPGRFGRPGRSGGCGEPCGPGAGYGPDAGSATVWLLALAMLGTVVFAATIAVGAVVTARHRAESAADLAALAAADRLLLDPDGGCGRAAGVAAAQGAGLVSCAVDRSADAVEVVAEVPVGRIPLRLPVGPARARARAGPIRAPATTAEDGPGEVRGGGATAGATALAVEGSAVEGPAAEGAVVVTESGFVAGAAGLREAEELRKEVVS
ncbi:Rv3654c family TadE-like protein [Kitasatospora sp. NPDC096077]|uniref:Rv3654c family TadE-like protein n=1 Tax=Kitasatospora sp. NPDC096077 TaxID=3155544 RepID=UPI00331F8F21